MSKINWLDFFLNVVVFYRNRHLKRSIPAVMLRVQEKCIERFNEIYSALCVLQLLVFQLRQLQLTALCSLSIYRCSTFSVHSTVHEKMTILTSNTFIYILHGYKMNIPSTATFCPADKIDSGCNPPSRLSSTPYIN